MADELKKQDGIQVDPKLLHDMSDTTKATAERVGDLAVAQEAMKVALTEELEAGKKATEALKVEVETLTKEQEEESKSIYDLALKSVGETHIPTAWGYGENPVSRALYRPNTKYVMGKGYQRIRDTYEVDSEVMEMNDYLYLAGFNKFMASQRTGNPITLQKAIIGTQTYKMFIHEVNRHSDLSKAMATTNTGEGLEWVPTGFSAQLIDDIRLALKVAALFPEITMPAGVGTWEYPFEGRPQDAYLMGEATTSSPTKVPAGNVPTGKKSFLAIKQALRLLFSDEMQEDSGIAIMPFVRQTLIDALAGAQETSTINGDNAAVPQDSDITAANDVRKSFEGLRKYAGGSTGNAAVDISTLNIANLRSIRKKMGRFGVFDCAWITGISGYIQLLGLTEVLTLDKIGNKATIISGQLGSLDNFPIVVSEYFRQDLNNSGVYDGVTETDTGILLANRKSFWTGVKPSGLRIDSAHDIETGQNVAVASKRLDFKEVQTPAATGEETVGLGYNLTS